MKGLLSAYSCLPNSGSENGLGWNVLLSATKVLDKVYLITKKSNQSKIEDWKKKNSGSLKNVEFVYVDIPKVIRKLPGHLGQIIRYDYFQRKLVPIAKKVVDSDQVDFCQHVTWASFIRKTYLYKLGIPFVLGPVGGGEMIPECIDCKLTIKESLTEWLRYNTVKKVSSSKVHYEMFSHSTLILATTDESKAMIPKEFHGKTAVQQAIGIDKSSCLKIEKKFDDKFVILMSGRMLYWKGFGIGLKAYEQFVKVHPDTELHIFGDGEKRAALEHYANEHSLCSVFFHGNVSHDEMMSYYKNGSVFLNCSLHDSGSFVVLEAMASGLPIITINTGGPSVLTDDICAVRIHPSKQEEMIDEICNALTRLSSDSNLCVEMGYKAQERAYKLFDYDMKYELLVKKIRAQIERENNEQRERDDKSII